MIKDKGQGKSDSRNIIKRQKIQSKEKEKKQKKKNNIQIIKNLKHVLN